MFPYKKYTLSTNYTMEECISLLKKGMDARFINYSFVVFDNSIFNRKIYAELSGTITDENGLSYVIIEFKINFLSKFFIIFIGVIFGILGTSISIGKLIKTGKFILFDYVGLFVVLAFYLFVYLCFMVSAIMKLNKMKKILKAIII